MPATMCWLGNPCAGALRPVLTTHGTSGEPDAGLLPLCICTRNLLGAQPFYTTRPIPWATLNARIPHAVQGH